MAVGGGLATMGENRAPAADDGLVIAGPAPPPAVETHGALPAVVKSRSDGSQRYIVYSDAVEGDSVDDYWLSVDADAVVSRELWR